MEARFYIPGVALKREKREDVEDGEVDEDEEVSADEDKSAANIWYETLVDKAEIGDVAGDTIATFTDLLHLTPRCVCWSRLAWQRAF